MSITKGRPGALVLLILLGSPRLALAEDSKDDFLAAARKGDAKRVSDLLDKGVDVNAKTDYGATALSFAAEKGHLEVVKVLLKHKADVNAKDTFYQSKPLTWAVYRGHVEVIKVSFFRTNRFMR
jgi:ankyrin repeat protein